MNASCPNLSNKQVKKEFDELVDVFGEDTAYFLWNKNEGYSLDKAPNGADSSLFQSLLNNYKGDRSKALVEAAKLLIANPTEEQNDLLNFKRNSKGLLLAPNGKVSHLSEKQYAQVRTKAFKDWFGDWENNPLDSSKVVDENGEPLVVYHGSNNDNLTIFKNNLETPLGIRRNPYNAFYFANNANFAENVTRARHNINPTIYSVFLNIKNPKFGDQRDISSLGNEFDGIIETKFLLDRNTNGEAIVWNPNQIKSATDNIGTFSRTNDDIRFLIDDDQNDNIPSLDEIYENNKYLSEQIINYLKHIGYNIHDIEDSLELFNKNPNLSKTILYIKTSNKKVLGFVYNNEIYIDKSKFTPETLLHEYTHIWDIAVAKRNPKLWDRGVELMKNTYLWEEIKNSELYGKLWEANGKSKKELDDLIASEVHSRLVGKNSNEVISSITKKEGSNNIILKLKQWLTDFWKDLIQTFGNITDNEINKLTLDDFNNMTLRDFVNGIDLNDTLNFKRNSKGLLLAPNGEVSHLTERQYAQVRTKAFKDWFGDWEKAANANRVSLGKEIPNTDIYSKYGQKGETDVEIREVLDEKGNVIGTVRMEFSGKNRKGVVTLHPNLTVTGKGYGTALYQHIADIYNINVEESFGEIGKSEAAKKLWNKIANTISKDPDTPLRQLTPSNSSKVVDENGEPLAVYHGTNVENISIFDRTKISEEQTLVGTGTATFGNFFSNKHDDAKSFANVTRLRRKSGKATVYDVFLNIKNPMYFETLGDFRKYSSEKGHYNDNGDFVSDVKLPKEYDGVIVKRRNNSDDSKEFVAPSSNQIKSATDNVGSFDENNDDIRFLIDDDNIPSLNEIYNIEKNINTHTDEVTLKLNTILLEISRQFSILARAYLSSPVKTKSRLKIENRVAITISRLLNASDIDAANLAIEQAALSIGFTNEDTDLNGKPKLYKWLYDGYNTNFKNMNSDLLVDAYKNSLKFYDTLLNNISKWYNFSNKDILSKIKNEMLDLVIKSIKNCNQLWVKAILVVGDREIDKYTDEIVDYPDSQKDAFKTNAKDWLHYNIFNYDIGGIEKNLGNYGSNGSQIIRMAMDIIKSSDLKTKKESIIMLNGIADAYKKFNKGIRHFETKSLDIFMEKDESGNYTGYFVRPLNYGLYYKNLNDFVSELNDKFDKEFGHHYIVQQGDNAIINSLTGEYAEDETWGNTGNDEDDMPVYYKYQLAINEWKGLNCERRYKPKYYAERMSRPFSETDKNGKINHGLSPKALFRYNRIQNRINYYLDIKLDKDTGISHPEKLDPEDQLILDDLYEQLDDLACPFEKDNINIRKEEEDYKIALEIKAWLKYINKENTKNINWKEFNKEHEIAKSENNEYNFLKYNASWGINEDLIDKVFGKFKDADDTVGSVLAGMLKQGLNSLVKVLNTIYKNLSKYDNNIDFYLSCKEADEYIDEHRNKQDKEAVELYNEYFQTKEQPYFDMAGNRYFRGKNENDEYVKIPASVNADYDALLTHFDYMVAKYTDIARNQGFIEGVANDDGSRVDFTNMTDQLIMDYVEGLFTYEKHYTDKNGNEVTKKVPLSIFLNMTPKTNKIDGVDTILYNPRGRFAEKNGPFFNENYNKNDLDKLAEQPIKSKYDNSKAFNKMSKDLDALNLYNLLIDVMKKSHSNYSAKHTAFNYKLPQIDAESSSILSRVFKKGIVTTSKELWNRMFNVNENDEAFRTQLSMQTSPDGSTNTSLPLRYVSPLKDPSNIGTNISSMVAQFANMSINYRNKQEILPKLLLFLYNLDQSVREELSEFGKNDQYNLGENQKLAYKNLLDTHVYENNPVNTNSKLYTFLYRLGRKSISILTLNTLGFNVNSAEAGFEDGLYRLLLLAILGKYFNIKDFISSIAYCTPMLFKTITNYGNVIANNKLQRMMQEYGVSSQIKESIKALGVSKLRKIAGGIFMGWFEMTDYISNSIFLKSFCNQIRFYNGDKVPKGFYSSYLLQLAFINAEYSAKEAKKAHRWLKTNVWNAYSYDGHGNLSIKPEYQLYITLKLLNAIFGSAGEKIAWINGTNLVGDTPLYRRSIKGMLIGGMRGGYVQNAQQLYFGRYDNIVRKIKSIQKETIENGKTSRRYKVEFEPLTDELRAIASSYSFNTGQPMDQSFRASYTALCKTARMLGRVIRIKQIRNIKYSRVEKLAVIGLFITLVAMSLLTLGYRYVKDWADEVPNPKNKQEASDYNFRKQVLNIYIRRLVMGWSPLNIAELGEIINSITVYKNPTLNFVGILDYLKAGYLDDPDHANSDIISRGSYKYYTYGERRLMSAIGPINNIHNSFSNQGNAAITRFNENMFGGAIEIAGIKLKNKKKASAPRGRSSSKDLNSMSDYFDSNEGSGSTNMSDYAGGSSNSSGGTNMSDY